MLREKWKQSEMLLIKIISNAIKQNAVMILTILEHYI